MLYQLSEFPFDRLSQVQKKKINKRKLNLGYSINGKAASFLNLLLIYEIEFKEGSVVCLEKNSL